MHFSQCEKFVIKVIVLLSEGSMSLPPRHIRRYPASSSDSSSTAGPGSLDEGEEEDVFLKYLPHHHQTLPQRQTAHRLVLSGAHKRKEPPTAAFETLLIGFAAGGTLFIDPQPYKRIGCAKYGQKHLQR